MNWIPAFAGMTTVWIGVLVLAGMLAASWLRPTLPKPAQPSGQFLDLALGRIHYVQKSPEHPQGDVLLVHGCPGSTADWETVLDELAKTFRVTAIDRPGHGFSDAGSRSSDLAGNAQAVREVIAALQLKNVIYVGHSYGSAVGLWLATHEPEGADVERYILLASPGYPKVDVDFISYVLAVPQAGYFVAKEIGPWIAERKVRSGIDYAYAPTRRFPLPKNFAEPRIALWARPDSAVVRAKELISLENNLREMAPLYPKIQRPVTLIQGSNDPVTRAAWKLRADIPNCRLIELAQVGHYPQYTHPALLLQTITPASPHKH